MRTFEVTWSEKLAQFLKGISPLLMGLGLLALFIEFKTPGFGFFGIAGGILLAVVFLSNYVAGLSGHEPILFFVIGVVLVAVEIFFFPGVAVVAVTGLALMLGALVWSMADLWPNQPISITGDTFVQPLINVGLGLLIAAVLALLLLRFLPRGWFWDRMVLSTTVRGKAQVAGGAPETATGVESLLGRRGVTVTGLFPSGQVEIEGRRYEARVQVGSLPPDTPVQVVAQSDFGIVVEKVEA